MVDAEHEIGGAGPEVQAAVERLAGFGAFGKILREVSARQLHAELNAEVLPRQKPLVTSEKLNVADAGLVRGRELVAAVRERTVAPIENRHNRANRPVGRELVVRADDGLTGDGGILNFLAAAVSLILAVLLAVMFSVIGLAEHAVAAAP